MRFKNNRILLPVLVFLYSSVMLGQRPPSPAFRPPPPRGLPIDDGLVLLLLASIVLGFYKLYYTKKASI